MTWACVDCGQPEDLCRCAVTPRQRMAERKYRSSAKGRYTRHKANAKRRGVEFLLTFEQWLKVWIDSGHWCDNRRGGYHMCRCGDVGPYALGNVYIGTKGQNCAERNKVRAARLRGAADSDD